MGPKAARVADAQDTNDNAPGQRLGDLSTPAMDKLRAIEADIAAGSGAGTGTGTGTGTGHEAAADPDQPAARGGADGASSPGIDPEQLRIVEALLFAASEPLDEASLAHHLKGAGHVGALLGELQRQYAPRGVNLVQVAGKWALRTAADLSWLLEKSAVEERRLSRAALETLSIIAYHQPVTRAEIEEVRGVTTSKGTLDVLLETGWVRPRGRRRAPGKPVTYGTTAAFLEHFGLDAVGDLPGLAELKAAGLLDGALPAGFGVPTPTDVVALMPDELPLEAAEEAQAELDLEADADEAQEDDAADAAPDDEGR
jgi:segregation and condensation protein B